MLVIETPASRIAEREYVLGILLGDHLGLEWTRKSATRGDVLVYDAADPARRLTLPDTFFGVTDRHWLERSTVPQQPVGVWDAGELGLEANIFTPLLPVIFGNPKPQSVRDQNHIALPIDVFGSAFFMLTRYEEVAEPHSDAHGRFPATASLAYRGEFLDRPIVDEYTEILWAALNALWPNLNRKWTRGRTVVTCDVDNPYAEYTNSWESTIRKCGGDLLKRKSVPEAWRTLRNTHATRRGDYRFDPYDMFDWMMEVNERVGSKMTFFFLCSNTQLEYEAHYSIKSARIRRLMKRVVDRGHEVGIHGSYHAYRDSPRMRRENESLREAMSLEGVERDVTANRQHYLRWATPETAQALGAAGILCDSTLGYADYAGFRCGTSRPFTLFDVVNERALKLVEHPLIAMDNTVIEPVYMGLGYTQNGLDEFGKLKYRCIKMGGEFTILWHNSTLRNQVERDFYQMLIGDR